MTAIVAMARNRVIGRDGKLPWHLPGELQFFKRTTMGHVIVMGRKTFMSIGRPLPGRENLVLSRTAKSLPGARVLTDFQQIPTPADGRKVFVIGGAEIYAALLPHCTEVLLTAVNRDVDGDTFLPPFEHDFALTGILEQGPDWEVHRYIRTA